GRAQDTQRPDKSDSVLRATTRLVVLDVVVVDDKGNPITGLKAEDFTVLEDGKPQTIRDFSFQSPNTVPTVLKLAPGVVSNAPQYGNSSSLNVILLDAINTDFSNRAYAQDLLIKYLESSPVIQPTAVFALEGKLTLLHDFTTDTKALRDVLANFKPSVPVHVQGVDAAATPFGHRGSIQSTDYGRNLTFNAISFLANALSGYPGRKNLIWLSEGFPISLFPDAAMDGQEVVIQDFSAIAEKIADDLMNAQVALYPIDAAGVSLNDRFPTRTAMRSMSERTGGRTFYNRNDLDMGIRTSIDDGSTYYTMDYYPQNKTWDDKFRTIEVKLNRPGVHLRYRQGYFAQAPAKEPVSAAKLFTEAMLLDAPPATGVLFQALAAPPSEKNGNKPLVNFGIDPHTLAFQRGTDELQHVALTCAVWAFPSKGDPVRKENDVTANLKEDEYRQVMHSYFPCKTVLDLKPGHYTLRLGVIDRTTNLIGTTTTQITVP
ncbi:MAG TPA: VWA domain-containing protein, partial [Candidatus Angelobacter sp.]|nr:VWA domain-containing protein [Candidatus Angelobacter sp.]